MRNYDNEAQLYKDFCDSEPSDFQSRVANRLQEADALCAKCLKKPANEFLCLGTRLVTDLELSSRLKEPKTKNDICYKLQKFQVKNELNSRLEKSGIPHVFIKENFYDTGYNLVKNEDDYYLNDKQLHYMYNVVDACTSSAVSEELMKVGLSGLANKLRVRTIYSPVFFSKYEGWNSSLFADYGDAVDVLIILRYDLVNPPGYIIDLLYNLLIYRKEMGLLTILSAKKLQEHAKDSQYAITFKKEINSWNKKLPLRV